MLEHVYEYVYMLEHVYEHVYEYAHLPARQINKDINP